MASIGRSWSLRAAKTFRKAMKSVPIGHRNLPRSKAEKLAAYGRIKRVTKFGEFK